MWAVLIGGFGPCAPPAQEPASDVVVQLFEWPYADVGRECEAVLGPAGVGAVQVSPPQEHLVLDAAPWWERYQPVSSKLEGRLGSRRTFADMVRRCARARVEVMVDVVLNHTTGAAEGRGSAGTPFRRYHIPGLYDGDDFHACRRPIRDWGSPEEVWTCELFGLPDLATERPDVRAHLAAHLQDLGSLGVRGLRIDSAKHVAPADLKAILGAPGVPNDVVLEVIDHGNEAVGADRYWDLGRVTDFRYGLALSAAFRRLDLASLRGFGDGLLPGDAALVFVDNHDTQRQPPAHRPLTFEDGWRHEMAVAFMLAWPRGRPRVMSSYAFDHRDRGAPVGADGRTAPALDAAGGCRSPFVCEHRTRTTVGMVGFRRAVGDGPVERWWTEGPRRVAFSRGDRGFVVFNAEVTPLHARVPTSLPPGRYCDVSGRVQNGETCPVVHVDEDGHAVVAVQPHDVMALHREARP